MTLTEWATLPDEVSGELADGRLEEEEVLDNEHEEVVRWLMVLFSLRLASAGGFVLGSGAKFALAEGRGRKPDLSVYLPGGHVPPRRGLNRAPPDIVVEVVSGSPADARRDRIVKFVEYARFGVQSYWIVDPRARTLEIYELGADGRYVRAVSASSGMISAVPLVEELAVDLDALWAELERLGPAEE